MPMEGLLNLWSSHAGATWWQAVLYALFFAAVNGLLFFLNWTMHLETILECGYKNRKTARKKFKTHARLDRILLTRLVREAPKSNPILRLRLVLNWSNLLCAGACFIGFVGTLATRGQGWAMVLLMCSGLFSIFFSVGITFIPDLLWVPSERRRYGLGKKKK